MRCCLPCLVVGLLGCHEILPISSPQDSRPPPDSAQKDSAQKDTQKDTQEDTLSVSDGSKRDIEATDATPDGSVCIPPCTASTPCNQEICVKGQCVDDTSADNTKCTLAGADGTCQNGVCCTGCVSNGVCFVPDAKACGKEGGVCVNCWSSSLPCKLSPVCNNGSCEEPNELDGAACPGGVCVQGACCTGCISNGVCQTVPNAQNCGKDGNACQPCTASPNPCTPTECVGGVCKTPPKPNTTPCLPGILGGLVGQCRSGTCCDGCWFSGTCWPGTEDDKCGTIGNLCEACIVTKTCINFACK